MAANKPVRFGPSAVTNAVTNQLNPGTTAGGVNTPAGNGNLFFLVKHIRWVNKTASIHTISAFVGATGGSAAGTEIITSGTTVPANGSYDYYATGQGLRLDVADFLTMVADANTSLVWSGEGEIGIA